VTSPLERRLAAAAGLLASLAGLPVLLWAVVGPPAAAWLSSWQWLAGGLQYQHLPVEPLLAAIGVLTWVLWGYGALATGLRLVAVVATRWGMGGSARLLSFSNLVTVGPLRSLVDGAVGVSLLTAAPHAVATPMTPVDRPAVVRTIDMPTNADRAHDLLGAGRTDSVADLVAGSQGLTGILEPDCRSETSEGRVYTVVEGDSLWRIAEQELGDGRRWTEIFAANQGRRMGDGQVLQDSELILPGWQLQLPTPAPPPPTDPPPAAPAPGARPEPPPPAGPAAPPASSPDQPGPPTPAPAPADHAPTKDPAIVELPSGSMVGLSVAVGIAAALAIAGLRRRRRRRPLWPPAAPPNPRPRPPMEATPWLLTLAAARAAGTTQAEPSSPPDAAPRPQLPPAGARDPRDPTPARVAIGERAGQEVTMDLAGHGAIGIVGSGAEGLIRAAVVGLVAAGGPAAVEVLLVGNQLIPDAIGFPGLRRAASLAGALHVLEAELVHRARLLEIEDLPHFASHRRQHPDDPLPALVLVTDRDSMEETGRLAAILVQGPRLGVGALLAGSSVEPSAHLGLDTSGRIQTAGPWPLGDQQLVGVRACSLTSAEAAELLGVLAQSRIDDPDPLTSDHSNVGPAASPEPAAVADPGQEGLLEEADALPAVSKRAEALVQVRLLGPFTIQTATGELRSGLRASARELLAYYLIHPEGASLEQAVEAMWPDTELGRERERFWTALGNLRSTLRKATGAAELKAIQRDGLRYRADRELFGVDLWRFQAAVAAARRADLDTAVAAALTQAGEAYLGDLLDGVPYGWVEIPREDTRRQAVDALARLAELRQAADDLPGAVVALEQAIVADPVAEELYRRLMRFQADLGRPDAVGRTYRLLARRLAELDVDPDPETEQLVAILLRRPGA
jgi:DNA-binding SARP family transcriptional activator